MIDAVNWPKAALNAANAPTSIGLPPPAAMPKMPMAPTNGRLEAATACRALARSAPAALRR
jgi:hypothetical protein